ncbi:folate family ECF transporter S component [Anaerococcus martiniensis]|uniref:folate family ECF transporter S component n=1 Tax=Anaerococcus sp. WGS1579 TaxID=3366809 RepID=UPI00372D326B
MNKKLTVNMITKMSIFAALTVIFRRFLTITIFSSTKIGLGYLPTIMAGILYGPLAGGITGGVADVVGMLMKPDGVFHPGFTLSNILIGAIPGFISYNIFKRDFKNKLEWICLTSCIFVFMGVRLLLDSLWLTHLYSNPYIFYIIRNFLKDAVEAGLNALVLIMLFPKITKYAYEKL